MSQVTRYHHGVLLVPVDLLSGIDSLYDFTDYPGQGCEWFFEFDDPDRARNDHATADAMTRLVTVPGLHRRDRTHEHVIVNAGHLSTARNFLDAALLNSDYGDLHGEDEAVPCASMCEWCQTILLRDWCDLLLDGLGQYKNLYIGDVDYDVAAVWRNAHGTQTDPEGTTG